MSFLLYNPLEAMIIILPLWISNKDKINLNNKKILFKIFIKHCYVLGCLFLLIQLPLTYLKQTLFYIIYDSFICFILMLGILIFYNKILFKETKIINCLMILLLYFISLVFIISNNQFYLNYINNANPFINELIINLYTRFIQFLLIIFGGFIMLKKNLIKTAKKNLGKTVASTIKLVGESKLSDKLKTEVKNSK